MVVVVAAELSKAPNNSDIVEEFNLSNKKEREKSCCEVKLVFLDRRKTFVKNIESQEREIREADIRADNFTYSV